MKPQDITMNLPADSTGDSLAALWMSSSFLSDLIVLNRVDEMAQHLCEQLRELTGAKTVVFFLHTDSCSDCEPLYVCPQRRAALFADGRFAQLCPACHPEEIPVEVDQIPEDDPLRKPLTDAGVKNLLRFPIRGAEQLMGSFVVMDLPDPQRSSEILTMMEFLGPTIALAIQNCTSRQQIQAQHDSLKTMLKSRTAEIEEATQELNAARLAALNMMEDALVAKEKLELTQFAVDHSADAIFWINSDASFSYVNKAACEKLGYTQDELLSLSVFDIDPELPAKKWPGHWEDLLRQKVMRFETTHKTKLGETFPIEVLSSTIQFQDKKYVCAYARDITERKQARTALEESRQLLSTIIDTLPARVWWKDRDSRYIGCNIHVAQDAGLDHPDQMIGKTDFDMIWASEAERFVANDRGVIESGMPRFHNDKPQVLEDGSTRWVNISQFPLKDTKGKIIGTLGTYVDITERKQSQLELEESRRLLRTIIDTMPGRVWWKDRDSRFLGCNIHLAHDAGLDRPEQLIGKDDYDFCWSDEADHYLADEHEVLESGKPKLGIEESHRQADGSIHLIETNKIPLRSPDGEIIGTMGTYADITERKQAQTELEESRRFLRTVIDTIPVRVFWKDSNSTYLGGNKAFAEDAGLNDPAELVGKTDFDLFQRKEDAASFRADDAKVIESGKPRLDFEEAQLHSDGINHWLLTNKLPLTDPQNNVIGVLGTYEDITEQKRMRETIEKRILALTRPLEDIGYIAFEDLFDIAGIQKIQDEFAQATGVASLILTPDGTPITKPSNFTRLCKDIIRKTKKGCANCKKSDAAVGVYNPDGPIVQPCLSGGLWDAGVALTVGGKHVASWLIGQVRDETQTEEKMRAYAKEIGADENDFMEAYRQVPEMSQEHFGEIAQALYTLAQQLSTSAYQNVQQARFIADEKRRTAELQRLSTAIEQSPESVVITYLDGIIQYVNPAFEEVSGYSREEALGQNIRFLGSGKHNQAFYSNMWKTIQAGNIWKGRFINQRKNGQLYTEDAIISPIKSPDGTITNYVGINKDITDELAREEQLQQAQKMEAVGQLAGGIAHDFNNILQAILGFSELLFPSVENEEIPRNNVLEIQKAAKHAADLTKQLLVFSRKQPVQINSMDLNASITETRKILTSIIGENIQIIVDLQPDLNLIQADEQQVSRVVINLTINARDAMPKGGQLTLRTRNVTFSDDDVKASIKACAGDFVCLSVNDTGTGMSEKTMQHIFEPFFSTKAPGKGTGLGLASVYGIVQTHHGWINVYSEEGSGSTFKIYFPVSANESPTPKDPDSKQRTMDEVHGNGQRILIVEDDPSVRQLSEHALKSAGYTVATATNAEEALEIFEKAGGGFDLLFSDVILPNQNGADLAATLQKTNPNLPIILCSGYSGDRIRKAGINQEGFFFLEKPFSIVNLLILVQQIFSSKNQE